jgi:hypothetical protein
VPARLRSADDHHQNPPGSIVQPERVVPPEQVTVTMPIHPLKGLALKLVGIQRDHLARRQMVIAEVADGSHIVLPIDWTDRGTPWVVPRLRGRDVRLSEGGLLSLARAVETALRQKLGPSQEASSAWTEAEHERAKRSDKRATSTVSGDYGSSAPSTKRGCVSDATRPSIPTIASSPERWSACGTTSCKSSNNSSNSAKRFDAKKIELTAADRARILELSKDLSVVWHAPTTTNAERKNLLRMLVCEVTASRVDVPRAMTRVRVLWKAGAVSDFTIERKTRFDGRATPAPAVAFIGQSFANKTDAWLAVELNRRKFRTGAGLPWTLEGVRRVRYQHQ